VERFGSGKVDMERILAPAIELGEKGFPISEVVGVAVRHPNPSFTNWYN
jgi:gamma-glutamyltranspeptidase/glutathione hydrolase